MLERSISFTKGAGSVNHNARNFIADNVDKDRIKNNIQYCHDKIENAYKKLFGEALEKYNAKQKRKDRKIENYYDKIRNSKQEKPFHEVVVQIGDKDNMGAKTEYGQLAGKILDEYMKSFAQRNPYLYVYSAHLHMDEATPHLHIDFIPFTTNSKRSLETRVSLKAALENQGIIGGTKSCTEQNKWYESEKAALSKIMLEHGVKWVEKGTHEKHKSVSEFKRDKLIEEVEALEDKKEELKEEMKTYKNAEEYAMATVRKIKENEDFEIKDPPPLMSAKTYKSKYVEPFIKKLLEIVKNLTRRCYRAEKAEEKSSEIIDKLTKEKESYKSKVWNLNLENSQLKVQVRDYDKIKSYFGFDKIQEILKIINKQKSQKRSDITK